MWWRKTCERRVRQDFPVQERPCPAVGGWGGTVNGDSRRTHCDSRWPRPGAAAAQGEVDAQSAISHSHWNTRWLCWQQAAVSVMKMPCATAVRRGAARRCRPSANLKSLGAAGVVPCPFRRTSGGLIGRDALSSLTLHWGPVMVLIVDGSTLNTIHHVLLKRSMSCFHQLEAVNCLHQILPSAAQRLFSRV